MPELVYRMLVTLLYVSKQWGYSKSCTVKFHLPFPSQVFFCGIVLDTSYGYEFGPDQLAPKDLKPSGFTKYRDTFPNFWWFAIGKQQWGITSELTFNSTTTITYSLPLATTLYINAFMYGGGFNKCVQLPQILSQTSTSAQIYITWATDSAGYYGSVTWLAIGKQQWGVYTSGTRNVTITLPIATSVTYAVIAVARTANNYGCSGSQNCQYVSNVTNKTFQAGSYDTGNGYAGFWWIAISKAQALPKAHRLKHCYIPTAIQLIFVPLYVGQIIELLVLAIHDVFSNVAPDHDSCAVVIQ